MKPAKPVALPIFRYHPDPVSTGSVRADTGTCVCCGKEPGFIYAAPVYAEEDLAEQICPWCIADGSAAERYDATFADSEPLLQAGISDDIVAEVTQRTPGYTSWQQDEWKCCCGDACEYHGNPSRDHLLTLDPAATEQFLSLTGWSPEEWKAFLSDTYEPGGSPAFYHFVCRGCGKAKYGNDSE